MRRACSGVSVRNSVGKAHSLMGIRVVAESEEDFQAWVSDWQTAAPTANAPEPTGR